MSTTPETNKPETFDIPEERFHALEAKLEKFAARSAKLGMAPIVCEVVGEKFVREVRIDGAPGARVRRMIVVKLVGPAPVLSGFTFVARTEHTAAGNIISKAPGVEGIHVPAELRDGGSYCDHCKTARNRIDTFILQTPDGNLMRVGRNCLADFIRSEDVATAIALWSVIADLRRFASEEEPSGGYHWDLSTKFIVAAAFRSVALDGWVSRKDAQEDKGISTASVAMDMAGPPPKDPKARKEWEHGQPLEADFAKATDALEWVKALPGASDYENNLKVACALEFVKERNVGIVASAVIAYQRYLERTLAETRTDKKPSAFFGRVDGRYIRTLTVLKSFDIQGDFGLTVLYVMEDADGNQFKWFSSGGASAPVEPVRGLAAGDTFSFIFGVKKHENYKGVETTVITRAGAAKTAEEFKAKWLSPKTGEVFKTKKELQATL